MTRVLRQNLMDRETMERKLKRVAALHDLSCFGRCALTVVIPTMSAMGMQVIPVPTALLSTHTGGFENMYFLDLESSIDAIGEHFEELGLDFDAIYTGFLGSSEQVKTVEHFTRRLRGIRDDAILFVDPVMGDDGEFYSACFPELVCEMRRLCASADIIVPNMTEACLLCDVPYIDTSAMSEEDATGVAAMLESRLLELTDAYCVITGVHSENGVGTYFMGEMHTEKKRARNYPGTGELFASVMLGAILKWGGVNDENVRRSAIYASKYVTEVMDYSMKYGEDEPIRDGVLLEGCMLKLCRDFLEE